MTNTLFLFLTQAEGGAPGYLSRLGEDAALNLAENLSQFLQGGLRIDFESGSERRLALLSEPTDSLSQASLSQKDAVALALRLHPEVLLLSGGSPRSKKTIAPLAEALALPVIELIQLDLYADSTEQKMQVNGIAHSLESLFKTWLDASVATAKATTTDLKLIVVQTSAGALLNWLEEGGVVNSSQLETLRATILEASENDRIPTVTAAAHTGPWPGIWQFDLTGE